MVHNVKTIIEHTKVEIEHKLTEARMIIKMLNSKTKDEHEEFNIQDRKDVVMEVKRVLTKKNLMVQLENKCKELELEGKRFIRKFNVLHEKELPP